MSLEMAMETWTRCTRQYFPKLHTNTYFLPQLSDPYPTNIPIIMQSNAPPYFTKLRPQSQTDDNLKPSPHADDSPRDDKNDTVRVLRCLRALGERQGDVMVVLSHMKFGNNRLRPCYAPATVFLSQSAALDCEYNDGDFDLLILHRKYGLIVVEGTSFGTSFSNSASAKQGEEAILAQKVENALKRLNKSWNVLTHLVREHPGVNVVKTLVFPNVTKSRVLRAVSSDVKVENIMCQCLDTRNSFQAVELCLCSDQMPSTVAPRDIQNGALQDLDSWWHCLLANKNTVPNISPQMYETLVARFCGPVLTIDVYCMQAPRLEVRFDDKGKKDMGNRYVQLCLHPQQFDVLNRAPPRLFLTGPPGTGKTLLLYLQGWLWLTRKHVVHVVSTYPMSRTASYLLEHQLLETMTKTRSSEKTQDVPQVVFHDLDLKSNEGDLEFAISRLENAARAGKLHIITDAVGGKHEKFPDFCKELFIRIPGVCLWAGGLYSYDIEGFMVENLTIPVRSPQFVVEVISDTEQMIGGMLRYTASSVRSPADGKSIRHLSHHNQPRHNQNNMEECAECGHGVARILSKLQVGMQGRPVQYRDVLVVCNNPRDYQLDSSGQVRSPASGLVRGLRERGFPVHVVERFESSSDIRIMALALENKVTVANWKTVQGLERKVVVIVGDIGDSLDRLLVVSRCTSELVWIDSPQISANVTESTAL